MLLGRLVAKNPNLPKEKGPPKKATLQMVGRTGIEPVTNGLKGRCASLAHTRVIGRRTCLTRRIHPNLPALCQILPT